MLTAVTGINWGDEGKGRVIDLLAEQADVVARYQGGNNAGHTVVTDQGKFVLNLLPSGILHSNVVCILGGGMVIDLEHLAGEIQQIREKGITVTPEHLKLSRLATISCHGIGFKVNWKKIVLPRPVPPSVLPAAESPMPTVINTERKHSVWEIFSIWMRSLYVPV